LTSRSERRASRSASLELAALGTTSFLQAAFPARTPWYSTWFALELVVLMAPERVRGLGGPSYDSTSEKDALFAFLRDSAAAGVTVLACSSTWAAASGLFHGEHLTRFGLRASLSLPDADSVVDRTGVKFELPDGYGIGLVPLDGVVRRFRLPAEALGPVTTNVDSGSPI
jgi:hypothetical protein